MAKHRSYSVEFKRQVVQDYLASETLDWVEEDFDPNIVDADELAEAVMALARRWSRNAPYHPTGKSGFRQTFLLGLSERSAHYRGLPRRLSSCGSREGREFRANLLR